MTRKELPPIGVALSADVEERGGGRRPFRARVRWIDPHTKRRRSRSEATDTLEQAHAWIEGLKRAARGGIDPISATMDLATYGQAVMGLAVRGLERKTLDPYVAGWRRRVVPTIGHLPVRMITSGAVDRAVHGWIAE